MLQPTTPASARYRAQTRTRTWTHTILEQHFDVDATLLEKAGGPLCERPCVPGLPAVLLVSLSYLGSSRYRAPTPHTYALNSHANAEPLQNDAPQASELPVLALHLEPRHVH